MKNKVRIGVVGLGKMGLSHFALANAHPEVDCIACDSSSFLTGILDRYSPVEVWRDYERMLNEAGLNGVVIATPSRLHAPMVQAALNKGIHVFCEKPFCLDWTDSEALADLAEQKGLVNRVGYHYRHVGAFRRMKEIVSTGALGRITHVLAEAYGPVVLRAKRQTWRSQKEEGGGCLYDYAAHPLNLLNWYFGTPEQITGSALEGVFSTEIDDQVFSTLSFSGGVTAQLSVNWSDESHRKMSTKIAMIGTNGRLYADRQECQLYLREASPALPGAVAGWNVQYTTELTEQPWFYLRGEEYSHQIDQFVKAIRGEPAVQAVDNDFRSAAITDRTIAMVVENSETGLLVGEARKVERAASWRRGWFARA